MLRAMRWTLRRWTFKHIWYRIRLPIRRRRWNRENVERTKAFAKAALAGQTGGPALAFGEFSGKHGHPYLVGRELIEKFLQAPATSSAREVEHRYQDHIRYVAVSDPFAAVNINTPEDYSALVAKTC